MDQEFNRPCNRHWTNVIFGVLVMIIPFLGLPVWMKNWLLLAFGLIITLVALSSQRSS